MTGSRILTRINKNFIKLALVLVFVGLGLTFSTKAYAEENQPEPVQNYQYKVEESNNLTRLVRRSLQLYDERDSSLAMSEAQIIYAETNIVQKLGAYQIDVKQVVDVPSDLVAEFAKNSQNLSEKQLATWSKYVSRADFDLDNIKPSNQEEIDNDIAQQVSDDQAADQAQTPAPSNNEDGADLNWFAVLGVAVVGFWLYLRRQQTPKG